MERALARVRAGEDDPPCRSCGGILKSATISFGQGLVQDDLVRAQQAAASCDLMLAVGTKLSVYPDRRRGAGRQAGRRARRHPQRRADRDGRAGRRRAARLDLELLPRRWRAPDAGDPFRREAPAAARRGRVVRRRRPLRGAERNAPLRDRSQERGERAHHGRRAGAARPRGPRRVRVRTCRSCCRSIAPRASGRVMLDVVEPGQHRRGPQLQPRDASDVSSGRRIRTRPSIRATAS